MIRELLDSAAYHGSRLVAPHLYEHLVPVERNHAFVSFTFDDFPRSARVSGGTILADHGGRGTYYVAMRFLTDTPTEHDGFGVFDLRALARDGHEMGCHTHEHIDCLGARDGHIVGDVTRNAEALARVLPGARLRHFAFPFGRLRPSNKSLLGARFDSLRTIFPGVHRRAADLRLLRANKLFSSGPCVSRAIDLIDSVAARGGWVIFFTHDVSDTPSPFGIRPADLARVVGHAHRHSLEILPVGEVTRRLSSFKPPRSPRSPYRLSAPWP